MLLAVAPGAASAQSVWIDVPFVPQKGAGCGAASIAMVMQYWQQHQGMAPGPAAEYGPIEQALYSADAHGIYASAMARYFDNHGFRAFAFLGRWSDVGQHLAKGRPLIAAVKPGAGSPLHYVVVVGIDPSEHVVLLNDAAQRKLLKEDQGQFEKEWKAAGHWTLLAVPLEPGPK